MKKKIALLVLITTMLNVFPVLAAPSGRSVTTTSLGPGSESSIEEVKNNSLGPGGIGSNSESKSAPKTNESSNEEKIEDKVKTEGAVVSSTKNSQQTSFLNKLPDVFSVFSGDSKTSSAPKDVSSKKHKSSDDFDNSDLTSIDIDDTIPEEEKNVQQKVTPTIKYGIVDDVPTTLSDVSLPDLNFKRPSNMPNINLNIENIFNSSKDDLNSKGFGLKKFNLQDKQMDITFASQGIQSRLSNEDLTKYLTSLEEKYLPQIQASIDSADGIEYDPIDLSSAWNLMSQEDSQIMSLDAGNYETMKNNLKSTIRMPSLDESQSEAFEAAVNSF